MVGGLADCFCFGVVVWWLIGCGLGAGYACGLFRFALFGWLVILFAWCAWLGVGGLMFVFEFLLFSLRWVCGFSGLAFCLLLMLACASLVVLVWVVLVGAWLMFGFGFTLGVAC